MMVTALTLMGPNAFLSAFSEIDFFSSGYFLRDVSSGIPTS
jgi:hypothetical protein